MPRMTHIQPRPQVVPVNVVAPGHRGLDLQRENTVLPPEWATEASNAIIDQSNRVASRLGNNTVTATPIAGAPAIKTIFEQRTAAGTGTTIIAWNGGISTSLANPSGSDISGAVTNTNGSWHFANFVDKCIGFQAGQKIIVRTTGNFATVVETSGTAPTGGVGTAAYGRIWQVDADGHTIKYSGLLNETQWNSGGAGQFDMQNVWTKGTDDITAIVAFNHTLVVFGRRHVVFLGDSNPTALGLDVTTLRVVDIIEGTGCVTQHSLQHVGNTDLVWLSPTGIQRMSRLQIQASRPTANVTKHVRDALLNQLISETEDSIRSVYSPTYGFYLLSFPASGVTWVIDERHPFEDEDGDVVNPITRWTIAPTALYETQSRALYMSGVVGGNVGQYVVGGDNSATFHFKFQSAWLDFGSDYAARLKMLKRIGALLLLSTALTVSFSYFVDFDVTANTDTANSGGGTKAEWGLAEWGIGEWSGGNLLQFLQIPAYATGQYFRFAIEADVSNTLAVQNSEIFAKLGRIAGS